MIDASVVSEKSIRLREYQNTLIQQIYSSWASGKKKVLAQLPTGAGKTICFAEIVKSFAAKQQGVLVLAHRQELIEQAATKITETTGLNVGIIRSGVKPDYSALVQVASVQSLGSRMDSLGPISLVICDEAHHSMAKSWRSILSAFPDQYILGFTATPIRLDGSGFIDQYDALVQGASVADLINDGFLCSYRLYAAPQAMGTESVRKQGGDYSAADLAKQNNVIELSGHLIESYRRHANGLQAVVFAINVDHSKAIAERYNREGIAAAHLDGKASTKERANTIAAFRRGEIRVLANCNLFDEGFDLPSLGCVQIARPTQSLGKYLQMLGRGARPSPGKDCAIYIDHTNNYLIHSLPDAGREWSLDGVDSELVPIGRAEDGQVVRLSDDAKRDGRAIIELEYVVLKRIEEITWPDNIAERYLAGESITQLAKELCVHYSRIRNHLEALGVKVRDPNAKRLFPGDVVNRCLTNPSVRALAEELGVSLTTLSKHLKSQGIEPDKRKIAREKIANANDLSKRYLAGETLASLAKEMGVREEGIAKHLRLEGVEIRKTSAKKNIPDNIVDRYLAVGSVEKLAKELGVSNKTLYKHLRSLGIDTSRKKQQCSPSQPSEKSSSRP
jgi:superfamily II DNA or RNA helicase/phage antirepressor YoqD-like protein